MFFLLQLLFVILAVISNKHEATTDASYTTMLFPITKHIDAAKPLYSVEMEISFPVNKIKNFIIDTDAPFIWYDCLVKLEDISHCPSNTVCRSPVSCEEYQCSEVRTSYSYKSPYCYPKGENNSTMLYEPNFQICACPVNVVNPMTGVCRQPPLDYDDFTVRSTDGRNVLKSLDYFFPNVACTNSTFESLPENVSCVMALSSSLYAFPGVYTPYSRKFSLCLPSNLSSRGVLLYGTGPFYLFPQSDVDVRSYLSYTPLVKHQDSFGYFISVNSIVIKTRSINVPANASTKLSTMDPYTTLRTDIYKGVVRRFSLVTKRLPPASPVTPFGLCFNTSTTGLKVPDIEFNLPDGKKWSVSTGNSIKQVTNDTACLAFVDGGATSEHAIVIGTFQLEDNFLVFDVEASTLGFSSSLLRKKTSCGNFNFTITG